MLVSYLKIDGNFHLRTVFELESLYLPLIDINSNLLFALAMFKP